MDDSTYYTIALSMVDNIGPVAAKNLISYCGSAKAVFEANKKELLAIPSISMGRLEFLNDADPFRQVDAQIKYIEKHEIAVHTFLDSGYPQRLRNFEQSPIVLYHKGKGDLNHPRTIAIIGTRNLTNRGEVSCSQIVEDLKAYDVQIISGLAYGADACAHKAAVKHGISTLGILGHGHDVLYPAAHRNLAESMYAKGGTVTEFPIKSRIDFQHFPIRNRIIAMMSDAVVVIESAEKGGSMITAEFANDYNKDVFALPGRIGDKYSSGCNLLIKSHRAQLMESAKDIGYIMRWSDQEGRKPIQKALFVELDDQEQKVVDILEEQEDASIDLIHAQLEINNSELASLLINLEFKGVIKSLPGKRYMLI